MKKHIKKHQVAFNMNDPDQKKMYDYLSAFTNVSAKLKGLILKDMDKTPSPIIAPVMTQEIPKETVISDLALKLIT